MITVGSLFSGIGGLDLGLEQAGMKTIWQVEYDDWARGKLDENFPHTTKYKDVREVGKHNLEPVDLIAGGFPCQDVSWAGPGEGLSGERSGLWFEYLRIICELRPSYIIVENVAALLNRGAGRVLADLAGIGFDAEWETLRASDFGAPHRRDRFFLVAYANQINGQARMGSESHGPRQIFSRGNQERIPIWLQAAQRFIGVDDGVHGRFYQQIVSGYGNAVCPPVAKWIGERIIEFDSRR
jgi:DNA (cytosine-5)-methyltransferase 1